MKLLSIIFLIFSSSLIFSQEVDPGFNSVIAPSGLKLRDAPNLNSKAISVIPYKNKIVYVDEQFHGCDTIGILPNFPGRQSFGNYSKRGYKDRSIAGNWVHIRHKKKEGYVFNPYLGPEVKPVKSQDFFLISPGENCGDHFYELDQFFTYGVYSNGDQCWTEIIHASYIVQTEGIGFLAPILTTNKNKYLQYVIGSRKPLIPNKQRWSIFNSDSEGSSDDFSANLPEIIVSDSIVSKNAIFKKGVFFDRVTGKEQKICNADYGHEYQIIGKGDLDGDGQTDILLQFRNAEYLIKRLYLSTLAKEGAIYGLAAEETFGYCC